jgi:hypothetical protein
MAEDSAGIKYRCKDCGRVSDTWIVGATDNTYVIAQIQDRFAEYVGPADKKVWGGKGDMILQNIPIGCPECDAHGEDKFEEVKE